MGADIVSGPGPMGGLVLCLHLSAVAFFVGGQLVFGIAVVPLLPGPGTGSSYGRWGGAMATGCWALVVLVLTGWGPASHFQPWDSSTLHRKLTPVARVIALALAHLRWASSTPSRAGILIASLGSLARDPAGRGAA